jgi:hypothetical protein
MCFFKSGEWAYLKKKRAFHHLENLDWQAVFLRKLTQFSQGNNELDNPASNIDGFLLKDTCFFNSVEKAYLEKSECI